MRVFKNLFGKGDTKIHVDEIAIAKDKLLSAGIIVESAVDANGGWIKFGNGIMVAWKKLEIEGLSVAPNSTYAHKSPFPQQFKNPPRCFFSGYVTDAQGNRRGTSLVEDRPTGSPDITKSNWMFHLANPAGASVITAIKSVSLLAIGDW